MVGRSAWRRTWRISHGVGRQALQPGGGGYSAVQNVDRLGRPCAETCATKISDTVATGRIRWSMLGQGLGRAT